MKKMSAEPRKTKREGGQRASNGEKLRRWMFAHEQQGGNRAEKKVLRGTGRKRRKWISGKRNAFFQSRQLFREGELIMLFIDRQRRQKERKREP